MIPILRYSDPEDHRRIVGLIHRLQLDPMDLGIAKGENGTREMGTVMGIVADVARCGDDADVEQARKFDDPAFTAEQLRVTREEMAAAVKRVVPQQRYA